MTTTALADPEDGPVCDMCGIDPAAVTAYWGAAYCRACCVEVAAHNDRHNEWPPYEPPVWW